jgi:hypothetical protein
VLTPSHLFLVFVSAPPSSNRTGFHFSLAGGQPCLNLLFPGWTLDSRFKFLLACFVVFGFAVSVEGFSKVRHAVVRAAKKARIEAGRAAADPHSFWAYHALLLRWCVTCIHALQAGAGYLLMLIAMTFSAELLFAVVTGLATGYGLFFQLSEEDEVAARHVTTNPCCEFMEEESREIPLLSDHRRDDESPPTEVATGRPEERVSLLPATNGSRQQSFT